MIKNYDMPVHPIFEGRLKQFRIRSNTISYGPAPAPDDVIEQRLTVSADGDVHLKQFCYGGRGLAYQALPEEHFQIDRGSARKIMDSITAYFSQNHEIRMATDIGLWNLIMFDDEGNEVETCGSLLGDLQINDGGLSEIIRSCLNRNDLFLFDGNPDRIDRLEIQYSKTTKTNLAYKLFEDRYEYDSLQDTETLILDREAGKLIYEIKNAEVTISTVSITNNDVISLLDSMAPDSFYSIQEDASPFSENSLITKEYTIVLLTKQKKRIVLHAYYEKNDLPDEWPRMIRDIRRFMSNQMLRDIFDEQIYAKPRRRPSDLVFCNVSFQEGGMTYCYLADDDDFDVGDCVVVPVGSKNTETIAYIESIEYHPADEAPYPLSRIKRILRKCYDDEDEP